MNVHGFQLGLGSPCTTWTPRFLKGVGAASPGQEESGQDPCDANAGGGPSIGTIGTQGLADFQMGKAMEMDDNKWGTPMEMGFPHILGQVESFFLKASCHWKYLRTGRKIFPESV